MEYDGIITEIAAGMCLQNKNIFDRIHNAACDRAIRIVQRYKDGEGLFQQNSSNKAERKET